jgi:hypothetical protein
LQGTGSTDAVFGQISVTAQEKNSLPPLGLLGKFMTNFGGASVNGVSTQGVTPILIEGGA